MGLKRKKLLKQGACIAVCSTMLATGVTQLIPAYQAQSLVFADEVQQNIKKNIRMRILRKSCVFCRFRYGEDSFQE